MARERPFERFLRRLWAGEERGAVALLFRLLLSLLSVPFRGVVAIRNRSYDLGLLRSHRSPVPVVCIGNLTAGGTGKTPLVEWAAARLHELGESVAVLARGYGAPAPGEENDEALVLRARLPGVPLYLDGDRCASARRAVDDGATVLLLDDGYQHRRLRRDLDVVLLDATHPKGYYRMLPSGMAREPMRGLARAGVVVLTRVDLSESEHLEWLRSHVRRHAPSAILVETVHRPTAVRVLGSPERAAEAPGASVHAFCGLGNPQAFEATVEDLEMRLTGRTRFADHHAYEPFDLADVARRARREGAVAIVTTRKDAVKIEPSWSEGLPVWVVDIAIEVTHGEAELLEALRGVVRAGGGGSGRVSGKADRALG